MEEWKMNHHEDEPPRSEVEAALNQLGNGKSPGIDDIPAEMWKATGEEGIDLLSHLCLLIWKKEEWPKDWCRAVFIPLPKKGNLTLKEPGGAESAPSTFFDISQPVVIFSR